MEISSSIANIFEAPMETVTRSNARDTAQLFGAAMCNLPSVIALWGSTHQRRKCLTAVIKSLLEVLPHEGVCIKNGERIIAAMYVIEPGRCRATRGQLLRLLPRLFVATGANLPRVLSWLSLFPEHAFNERHWHVSWFAVDPEFQGGGMGTRLLDSFCERVDRAGEAAYVATSASRNLKFYERHGFTITQKKSFLNVTNWLMRRPPKDRCSDQYSS